MNAKLVALTGAVASSLLWGATANADTISIGYSINGGSIITVTPTTSGPGSASYTGSFGSDFSTDSTSGSGNPNVLPPDMFESTSITVGKTTDAAESIQVYVTDSDITKPSVVSGLLSKFSDVNVQNGSLTETTYFSAIDAIFSGTQLATASTFPTDVGTVGPYVAATAKGFSLTEEYNFSAGAGGGGFNADMDIQATPIPAALPLFAGGLGLIGLIGRRRKRKTSSLPA